jgi:hypothetical protein
MIYKMKEIRRSSRKLLTFTYPFSSSLSASGIATSLEVGVSACGAPAILLVRKKLNMLRLDRKSLQNSQKYFVLPTINTSIPK